MKLKKSLLLKKFQKRIFIWITLTFVALLTLFSMFSYINIEKIVLEKIYKTNMDILSHTKFNVQLMDDSIKNLCKELFVNTDVSELMYSKSITTFESLSKMKNVELITVSNSFLDSVHIYNGNTGTLYSPGKSIITDREMLTGIFDEIITREKIIPILRPIVMEVSFNGQTSANNSKPLSYFMYQYTYDNGVPSGALIINIKASWLLNNLEQVGGENSNNGEIFAFSEKGVLINEHTGNSETQYYIKELFKDYQNEALDIDQKKGYIKREINGKSSIISFLNIDSAGLTLIRIQPYDDVFGMFNKMRIVLILITSAFLLIVFTVSVWVSKAIYKPLGSLVSRVGNDKSSQMEELAATDEMHYLEEVFRLSGDKIAEYENDKLLQRNTLKGFYLKKLLLNSSDFSQSDINDIFAENSIQLSTDMGFSVCILKIDGYRDFLNCNSANDRSLIKFAIINIMSEVLSEKYRNEGIDMDDEKVVFIISQNSKAEDHKSFSNNVQFFIKQAQEHILNYFKVSVSATLGLFNSNWRDMAQVYEEALECSNYRLVYGKMSIITAEITQVVKQTEFSFDYKKMLLESIKSRNTKKVENVMQKIYNETLLFEYRSIFVAMLSVVEIIEKSASEINSVSLEPVDVDYVALKNSIFESENLEEFYQLILEQAQKLCEEREKSFVNAKHLVIAKEIQEIINNEFFNSSLCLASIAARLKMSSGYVGKIFKDVLKVSVNEYINEVRLNKAVEWLEKSDLNINEIIIKVGIENETYFYSLFKKKLGVTPKEYMIQKGLKSKNN